MGADTNPKYIIAAGVVLPILASTAVALRFHTRRGQRLPFAADDWLTIPAAALTIGLGACLIAGVHYKGFGYPTPLPPSGVDPSTFVAPQTVRAGKLQLAFQLMQVLDLGLTKTSVVFFYRRIFCSKGTATKFNLVTVIWLLVLVSWTVSFFFATLFECGHSFYALWTNAHNLLAKCAVFPVERGLVISDFITDLGTLLLPLPMIWGLHLELGRKLAVTGVFLLGALAVAASITRMVIYIEAVNLIIKKLAVIDANLLVTRTLYWSMIEASFALIAACLPTFRQLFGNMSLDQLQRSLRNMLSLPSIRSHDSPPNGLNNNGRYVRYGESTVSDERLVEEDEPEVQTHALRDLVAQPDPSPSSGQIHVKNTVSHTVSHPGYASHEINHAGMIHQGNAV